MVPTLLLTKGCYAEGQSSQCTALEPLLVPKSVSHTLPNNKALKGNYLHLNQGSSTEGIPTPSTALEPLLVSKSVSHPLPKGIPPLREGEGASNLAPSKGANILAPLNLSAEDDFDTYVKKAMRRHGPYPPADRRNEKRHYVATVNSIERLLDKLGAVHPKARYIFTCTNAGHTSRLTLEESLKHLKHSPALNEVMEEMKWTTSNYPEAPLDKSLPETFDYSTRFTDPALPTDPSPLMAFAWLDSHVKV